MSRLGVLSFQSLGRSDVFATCEVWENGIEYIDEEFLYILTPQFDAYKTWVSGNIPKMKPVNVDGDTSIVLAHFTGDYFVQAFSVKVYIEYELAEEIVDSTSEGIHDSENHGRHIEVYM